MGMSWTLQYENGDIFHSESGYDYYGEQLTTFHHDCCLPVGCYDFVIDNSWGDGICGISDYYDDGYYDDGYYDDYFFDYYDIERIDDFDGYWKGRVYVVGKRFLLVNISVERILIHKTRLRNEHKSKHRTSLYFGRGLHIFSYFQITIVNTDNN